ncbi:PadR family transcriptional regulator [Sphingomonas abietis]
MRFGFHHRGRHGHHHPDEHGGRSGMRAMRGGFGGRGAFEAFGEALAERGSRGGGRRRLFDGGELRLVLLRLIGDQPRHGYDLIRGIEERTGGAYAPSPGVVYPTLTMLGDMGHIEEQASGGNRKIFAVTAEGQALLDDKADEIAALMARLEALGEARDRADIVSVRRAVHNMKAVLMHKLHDADVETIQQAVALIDEAAGKIERL